LLLALVYHYSCTICFSKRLSRVISNKSSIDLIYSSKPLENR
jgi:hypothetical protein